MVAAFAESRQALQPQQTCGLTRICRFRATPKHLPVGSSALATRCGALPVTGTAPWWHTVPISGARRYSGARGYGHWARSTQRYSGALADFKVSGHIQVPVQMSTHAGVRCWRHYPLGRGAGLWAAVPAQLRRSQRLRHLCEHPAPAVEGRVTRIRCPDAYLCRPEPGRDAPLLSRGLAQAQGAGGP